MTLDGHHHHVLLFHHHLICMYVWCDVVVSHPFLFYSYSILIQDPGPLF